MNMQPRKESLSKSVREGIPSEAEDKPVIDALCAQLEDAIRLREMAVAELDQLQEERQNEADARTAEMEPVAKSRDAALAELEKGREEDGKALATLRTACEAAVSERDNFSSQLGAAIEEQQRETSGLSRQRDELEKSRDGIAARLDRTREDHAEQLQALAGERAALAGRLEEVSNEMMQAREGHAGELEAAAQTQDEQSRLESAGEPMCRSSRSKSAASQTGSTPARTTTPTASARRATWPFSKSNMGQRGSQIATCRSRLKNNENDMKTETKTPMADFSTGGKQLHVLGHEITLRLTCRETDGEYFVFEAVTPPGAGVPLHVHRHEDEFFRVLEGEFEFQLGQQIQKVTTGAMIIFHRNIPHAFRNVGTKPGRIVFTVMPGANFEKFFEEMGSLPADREPDIGKVTEIFNRHDIEILPPQ